MKDCKIYIINIKIRVFYKFYLEFVILGFPCNQFGSQEPGENDEIEQFACKKYKVSFPMFDKVEVNGDNADPLWKFLTNSISESIMFVTYNRILWNFNKFLCDKEGKPVKRYGSNTDPTSIEDDLKKLLEE
jgi:glutathione peroxidase